MLLLLILLLLLLFLLLHLRFHALDVRILLGNEVVSLGEGGGRRVRSCWGLMEGREAAPYLAGPFLQLLPLGGKLLLPVQFPRHTHKGAVGQNSNGNTTALCCGE